MWKECWWSAHLLLTHRRFGSPLTAPENKHNDITRTCRHTDRPTLELWWPASTPAPHLTERWSAEPHYSWTKLHTECALLFLDNETISHWFMGHGHRALRCSHWLDVRRLSDLLTFRHEPITSMEKSACEWRFRWREKQTLTFSSWTAADGIKRWMNQGHSVFFFLINDSQRELHNTSNNS